MRWKRWVGIVLGAVLAAIVAAGLWFARPLTVGQMYPGLELDACVGMTAYYTDDSKGEPNRRTELSPGDEGFSSLLGLLQGQAFSRSPLWWIPTGTKTHRWEDGDFKWELMLLFEDVPLPDGSAGSGAMLQLNNFFGELDLRGYDGNTYPVRTSNQEQWVRDVLEIALAAELKSDSK